MFYEPAPPEVLAKLAALASDHHPELAGVRSDALLAASSGDMPLIEMKRTSPLYRVAGMADVIVILDRSRWSHMGEAQRAATLDHGLASISVATKADAIRTDSAGRPRLERRHADIPGFGYSSVAGRHRGASVEARTAREVRERLEQLRMFE